MIKTCIRCGSDYESPAMRRNSRGICVSCKCEKERLKYAQKRVESGEGYKDFDDLFNRGLKKCTICNEIKPLDMYSQRKGNKFRCKCKSCDSTFNKIYEASNREKINRKRRERRKDPQRGIVLSLRSRQNTLFKKEGIRKTQPTTKLLKEWLGCSIGECKAHIESLFLEKMGWNNRGVGMHKWQIDHKIPITLTEIHDGSMADTSLNRKIWHYTNLQPLWHLDNAKKSDSLIYL